MPESGFAGTHSSHNCFNYQKQLIAMGLWGSCAGDDNRKEVMALAVPSNSVLLKTRTSVPQPCKESGGQLRGTPLGVNLLRTISDPPSQLTILGCDNDDDNDSDDDQ